MFEQAKQTIDLRGLICPEPVLRTKKLFDNPSTCSVEATVDDDVCVNNLERLARSLKATCNVVKGAGYFTITLERSGTEPDGASSTPAGQILPHAHEGTKPSPAGDNLRTNQVGTVVFLSKDTFGQGDEEFSRTLMNLFLQTTLESGLRPRAILLANSGVKLLAKKSQTLKVLNEFKDEGCDVLACGLCVDFFRLKDEICKDQLTNMFAICEYLFAADKVLQL